MVKRVKKRTHPGLASCKRAPVAKLWKTKVKTVKYLKVVLHGFTYCKCLTTESKYAGLYEPSSLHQWAWRALYNDQLELILSGGWKTMPGTLQEATPPGPTVEEVDGPVLQTSNLTYSYVAWLILQSTPKICLTKQVSFAVALKRQINEIDADNLRNWTGWK